MGEDDQTGVATGGWFALAAHAQSAGIARAAVADACRRWHLLDLVDTASLLVTELVTNAVRHAQPPIGLRIARPAEGLLHVEVADHSLRPPKPDLDPDTATLSGRGLFLVDALASRWGYRPDGHGKTVWFELGRSGR